MKKIKSVLLFCTFFLALAAFAVQAGAGHQGKEEHEHSQGHKTGNDLDEHMKKLTTALDLSADQQTKIRAILEETQQQGHTLMNDTSLSKEEKEKKMQNTHEAAHAKIRELLNDDQKKKFNQMVQEMQEHHHDHEHK